MHVKSILHEFGTCKIDLPRSFFVYLVFFLVPHDIFVNLTFRVSTFLLPYTLHWSDPKTLFVFVLHKHKFVFVVCEETLLRSQNSCHRPTQCGMRD
jgi:hypothetical protein